jgi:hypothetical protein
VTDRTERVDAAIRHTMDRVDETADVCGVPSRRA